MSLPWSVEVASREQRLVTLPEHTATLVEATGTWDLLVLRGLLGRRTCAVYKMSMVSSLTVLYNVVMAALLFHLLVWPDPTLTRIYTDPVVRFLCLSCALMALFEIVRSIFARRLLQSATLCDAIDGFRGACPGSREGYYNGHVFDKSSLSSCVRDTRLQVILIGATFRAVALFLWEMPGAAVWAIFVLSIIGNVLVSPANDFIADLLVALSHDLVTHVMDVLQGCPDEMGSNPSRWRAAAEAHRKMDRSLARLWGEAMPFFWLRFVLTAVHCLTCLVGGLETMREKRYLTALMFVIFALVTLTLNLLRLWRIAEVTSRCMSKKANRTSILTESAKHCMSYPMSPSELAEYQLFLTYLSVTSAGAHPGILITKGFVLRLAIPAITLSSSLLPLILRHLRIPLLLPW